MQSLTLVKIYKRSLSDRCHQSLSVFGWISRRDESDRCHQSLGVFGRISRRDGSDRSVIAVVDRLAFLAEVRGAIGAIAVIDRRWFSAEFLVAITVRTKKT